MTVRYWMVVVAAGRGVRMGLATPKQYLPLLGQPLLVHTLNALLSHEGCRGGVVVLAADDPHWRAIPPGLVASHKPLLTAVGGSERFESVAAGLAALTAVAAADDWVFVHDAARPCLTHDALDALATALLDEPVGALLAIPVRDTLKRADAAQRVAQTPPREGLWQAQTPQAFRLVLLQQALAAAQASGAVVTDEASAVERLGQRPRLVRGRFDNLKVTTAEDLPLAELFLTRQRSAPS